MTKSITIFLIFLLTNTPLVAQAWSIGKIKGEASISRAGEIVIAQPGFELVASDVIETRKESRVLIKEGNNKIWLGANTKFKIGNFDRQRPGKAKTQILSLISGKIRSLIKKRPDAKKQHRFKTPTAVAGVRGTEFFIESTQAGEFFCTLDGSIEVETNKGDAFVVDEGKGLRLAMGNLPDLSGTSSFLVDRWVAETSFEDQVLVPEVDYPTERRKVKISDKQIYAGGFGSIYYCGKENSDFDDSLDDENKDCYRYYLSPFIQFGENQKIFLRAAAVGTFASFYGGIDEVPATNKKKGSAITVAEAYYGDTYGDWSIKLGIQDVEWADGVLLSRKVSAIEPISHLAITAKKKFDDYEFEFLGGPGLEDSNELEGHSHIATVGVKVKLPKNIGEIYALHTNFGERDGRSEQFHGQEFMNYGWYESNRHGKYDYSLSIIHQDLHQFYNASGNRGESQATATDVELGFQLGLARPMRISARHIKTGRNFVPVHEDFYTLSNGMIVSHRSNLEQYRAKLELQVSDSQLASLEYMKSSQVSPTGFRKFIAAATEKNEDVGSEIALTHNWEINNNFKWINTAWSFEPKSSLLGDDSAIGLNSRLIFNY